MNLNIRRKRPLGNEKFENDERITRKVEHRWDLCHGPSYFRFKWLLE